MFELRDYQIECVNRVMAAYKQDKSGCELLVLPTGSGKTVIFCQVIHTLGLNTLIIAHRDELLDQAADKYRMIKPNAIIGKVGSGVHQYGGEVTVASIATISRLDHIKKLQQFGYGLIIIDEAHHVAADSYQRVLEALPNAFVLMVTATPDRLDGKLVIEKKPLYSASIIDMIRDKYLCDIKALAIRTETNLDELHTRGGDFAQEELEQAVDTPARNKRVVDAYKEHADGRHALCFGVTVAHAWHLSEAFTDQGIEAAVVTGETPLDQRKIIYADLRSGRVKVVCNVLVLTEGFDEPKVNCIIMARPTQSRALYVQCIGRGLRLAPAKENCIILDLTDNCLKHRLEPQSLRKVLGKQMQDDESLLEMLEREEKEAKKKAEKAADPIIRKLKDSRKEDITVDLMEKLLWQERTDGIFVLEVGRMKHRIALVPCKGGSDDLWGNAGYYDVYARLAPMFDGQMWLASAPLDWAQQYAEKKARILLASKDAVKLVDRNEPWRLQPPTDMQLEKLAKWASQFRITYDAETITKGEASDHLDYIYDKFEERRKKRISA